MLDRMVSELRSRHGCHTVILYGSRARGDAHERSDWDLLGIREEGPPVRDARAIDGAWLDAFIETDGALAGPVDEGMFRLRCGRVVYGRDDYGAQLLARIEARFAEGPAPLPEAERVLRQSWCHKTLERIARGDTEANFRRAWLLMELLETWFRLRDRWYLGPKESLAILAAQAPEDFEAFDRALRPGAPFEAIERLVARVTAGVSSIDRTRGTATTTGSDRC